MLRLSIFIAIIVLVPFSCNNKMISNLENNDLEFSVLFNSNYGGTGIDEVFVCQDNQTLQNNWSKIYTTRFPKPEVPKIDFDKKILIIKNFPERRSGGFSVSVDSVKKEGENLIFMLNQKTPESSEMVSMALTQAIIIIELDKTPFKNIYFTDTLPE